MDQRGSISSILDHLDRAGEHIEDPALVSAFETAKRAVNASSSRADNKEEGVAARACVSVAGGAMMAVAAAARSRTDQDPTLRSIAHSLASLAQSIAGTASPKKLVTKQHQQIAPADWTADGKGRFKKRSSGGVEMMIALRGGVPGKTWSLYFGPVAVAAANDPVEAAEIATRIASYIEGGK